MKLSNYSLLISIVISFSLLKQNGNYAGLFLSHRLRQRGGGEWRGPAIAFPEYVASCPAKGPCRPLGTPC